MAKFFKNLFSTHSALTSDKKKLSKSKPDVSTQADTSYLADFDEKDFNAPYDTKRKMFTSRSGRMKHNQKVRGTLRKDLYGDVHCEDKTNTENQIQRKSITQNIFQQPTITSDDDIKKSLENIYNMAKQGGNEIASGSNHKIVVDNKENRGKMEEGNIGMDQEIDKMFKPVLIETTF